MYRACILLESVGTDSLSFCLSSLSFCLAVKPRSCSTRLIREQLSRGAGQSEKHFLATSTSGQPFRAEVDRVLLALLSPNRRSRTRCKLWSAGFPRAPGSAAQMLGLNRNGSLGLMQQERGATHQKRRDVLHLLIRFIPDHRTTASCLSAQGLNPSSLKRLCHTGMVTRGIKPERTWLLVSQM